MHTHWLGQGFVFQLEWPKSPAEGQAIGGFKAQNEASCYVWQFPPVETIFPVIDYVLG